MRSDASRAHGCRRWATRLAAGMLGELSAPQAQALIEHAAVCRGCMSELLAARTSTAALARLDPEHIVDLARERERSPVTRSARVTRRRGSPGPWRAVLVGATIGAMIMGITALRIDAINEPAPTVRTRAATIPSVTLRGHLPPGAVVLVQAEPKGWGSQLSLREQGVAFGTVEHVWLLRRSGVRVPAGSFQTLGSHPVTVTLAASIPVAHIHVIGITASTGGRAEALLPIDRPTTTTAG